jgi:hypothetical protein
MRGAGAVAQGQASEERWAAFGWRTLAWGSVALPLQKERHRIC